MSRACPKRTTPLPQKAIPDKWYSSTVEDQQELPLDFGHGGGTLRTFKPVGFLADAAGRWAEKMGKTHTSDQFANITADASHLATFTEHRHRDHEAPPPATLKRYGSLRTQIRQQYQHLTGPEESGGLGVTVEVTDKDPYPEAGDAARDIETNRRLKVLSTASTGGHALLSNEENDQFRAVHDSFGHLSTGRSFSRHGEEASYESHSRMFSDDALPALAAETRLSNATMIHGPSGEHPENKPRNVADWATRRGELPPQPEPAKDTSKQLELL